MGMLDEQGPGAYIPNRLTRALACPEYAGSIIFWSVISRFVLMKNIFDMIENQALTVRSCHLRDCPNI